MGTGGEGHSRSLISLSMSSTRDTTSRNSAGLNPVVSRADRFLEVVMELVGVEEDDGAELVPAELVIVLVGPMLQG